MSHEDVIVPPISRQRVHVALYESKALRDALALTQKERDYLDAQNNDYRRVIFALLAHLGGEVKITRETLSTMPMGGTIHSQYDARDQSVTFKRKETP